MFHFALVDDRHGLEAAVRMLTNATARRGRAEFSRTGVIQQQKRADVLTQVVVRKQRADRKTVTDPMTARAGVNTDDVFHVASESVVCCDG